jgi:phosphatidylinositol N-acetylglucosaminyltransferase subunit H
MWSLILHLEETLLVLQGLGVQTSTSASTFLSSPTTRFIPTNVIQDIFIHEAFKGFEVRFYLAIVVDGEEDVVVVFPVCDEFDCADYSPCCHRQVLGIFVLTLTDQKLLPKRQILEQVWRGAKACLYDTKS